MLPFLLIPVGVWIVWSFAKKRAYAEMDERARMGNAIHAAVAYELARRGMRGDPNVIDAPQLPSGTGSSPPSPSSENIGAYVEHLRQCTAHAAALNMIRPAAINADVSALRNAPPEAVQALFALAQPMDWLTVQRDLNLLGATPALSETGQRDDQTVEALKGLQERFNQEPTGEVDSGTAVAICYSVGVINAQNQIGGAASA